MSDGSKYFGSTKKGEVAELQDELNSHSKDVKKDAVKKVIAAMTIGKDVSSLFPHVCKNIETNSLELKKLVYLYIINYAKSQPDLALLAVNSFRKDSMDPANPLIRALAVRTMGCIRVDKISEYLCEPLRRCLKDEDPYVRKTAAISVAKMFDITPDLVEGQGFIEVLQDMLADANPAVVANATAALLEMADTSGRKDLLPLNPSTVQKLLAALNECTEWGQCFLLDALALYTPVDSRDAEGVVERVTPRLQHANAAVVTCAIRVCMRLLEHVQNQDLLRNVCRKLAPPLVTLLSAEPEIQYVALRNINLIVQKRPDILAHEIRVFFCKFNDPIYVKMEKLEVMNRLASERNVDQVLAELKEYASEVDVEFVRKAVRCIGRCAIKLERAAERCINVLLDLIQARGNESKSSGNSTSNSNYVVQEAIVVIKDIFRKYPNRYESIIATLCANLDNLDEPEAKAAMIWILGEYAERIDNAEDLIESFLESFSDETNAVQLTLLTAVVKLFLKKPNTTQDMVTKVLKLATEEANNPDLRDRGYIYWRLLSTDPEATKQVVLSEKPSILDESGNIAPSMLDKLIDQIGTISSVYHKLPDAFVLRSASSQPVDDDEEPKADPSAVVAAAEEAASEPAQQPVGMNLLDFDDDPKPQSSASVTGGGGLDLLAEFGAAPPSSPAPSLSSPAPSSSMSSLFGSSPAPSSSSIPMQSFPVESPPAPQPRLVTVLTPTTNGQGGRNGLQLDAAFERKDGNIYLHLKALNHSASPIDNFAFAINKNAFGLAAAAPLAIPSPLQPRTSAETSLLLTTAGAAIPQPPAVPFMAQIAIRTSLDVFYFNAEVPLSVLVAIDGPVDRTVLINAWKATPDTAALAQDVAGVFTASADQLKAKLSAHHFFFVVSRPGPAGHEIMYFAAKLPNNALLIAEVAPNGAGAARVAVKAASSEGMASLPLFQYAVAQLLTNRL